MAKKAPETIEQDEPETTPEPAAEPTAPAEISIPTNWKELSAAQIWDILDAIWLDRSVRLQVQHMVPLCAARAELDRNGRVSGATIRPLQKLLKDKKWMLQKQQAFGQRPAAVQS